MAVRKVVEIDQDKCDGCELCVHACHEGAIAIVDGKATLVSESYCDGLGACLPECPRDAIRIVERQAAPFDEQAVAARMAKAGADRGEREPAMTPTRTGPTGRAMAGHALAGGCPGAASRSLGLRPLPNSAAEQPADVSGALSALANWPVQLTLAPVQAPYFEGATLLVAADCVPFAYPEFHGRMLAGRTLLIGCPKLDDAPAYLEKLTAILRLNDLRAIEVAFMEVPCCHGLVRLVAQAVAASGKSLAVTLIRLGIHGEVQERSERPPG